VRTSFSSASASISANKSAEPRLVAGAVVCAEGPIGLPSLLAAAGVLPLGDPPAPPTAAPNSPNIAVSLQRTARFATAYDTAADARAARPGTPSSHAFFIFKRRSRSYVSCAAEITVPASTSRVHWNRALAAAGRNDGSNHAVLSSAVRPPCWPFSPAALPASAPSAALVAAAAAAVTGANWKGMRERQCGGTTMALPSNTHSTTTSTPSTAAPFPGAPP